MFAECNRVLDSQFLPFARLRSECASNVSVAGKHSELFTRVAEREQRALPSFSSRMIHTAAPKRCNSLQFYRRNRIADVLFFAAAFMFLFSGLNVSPASRATHALTQSRRKCFLALAECSCLESSRVHFSFAGTSSSIISQ